MINAAQAPPLSPPLYLSISLSLRSLSLPQTNKSLLSITVSYRSPPRAHQQLSLSPYHIQQHQLCLDQIPEVDINDPTGFFFLFYFFSVNLELLESADGITKCDIKSYYSSLGHLVEISIQPPHLSLSLSLISLPLTPPHLPLAQSFLDNYTFIFSPTDFVIVPSL